MRGMQGVVSLVSFSMSGFTKFKERMLPVSRGVLMIIVMEALLIGLVVLSVVYPEIRIR